MNKFTKLTLSMGTAVAAVAPIAAVVSCGSDDSAGDSTKYVKYTGGAITKDDVYFVTDGGSVTDKSFNQSGVEGFREGIDGVATTAINGKEEKPAKPANIIESYNNVKTKNGKLIVAMGFLHQTALKEFTQDNPKMGVVFVDETLEAQNDKDVKLQQGNVVSIIFKTEQAAFLEGVVSGKKANEIDPTNPAVGIWGGMKGPSVDSFLDGFKQGISFYNAHKPAGTKDVKIEDGGYAGNFNQGGGRTTADSLLSKGADLLMAVAGPQAQDAIAAIKAKSNSKALAIGVDTDLAQKVGSDSQYVFGSILKELKLKTKEAVQALIANTADATYGFGKVVKGDLTNNGISISNMSLLDDAGLLDGKTKDDIMAAAKKATA